MLALDRYESELCRCGTHPSLLEDKRNHFTFDEKFCPVCKGGAQFSRIQAHADHVAVERMGDDPPPGAPLPSDGRTTVTVHTYKPI